MYTLYSMPTTRAGRVRWALEEIGAPYREVKLDRAAGEHKLPAFLAINPLGRVPTLVDGDTAVSETAAILLHLADRHPDARLAPQCGTPARTRLMEWLFLTYNELEAPLTVAFQLTARVPEPERLPAVAPWCQARFAEAARVFESRLAGRSTLLDEGFGVGDITLAGILSWAHDDGLLDPFPALAGYRRAMLDRPAARRAYADDTPT